MAARARRRVLPAPPAWRHYCVMAVCFGVALLVAARVVSLGVNEREFLLGQGEARSVRNEIMPAHRGVIYDRHGEPLAVSTPAVSIWYDPTRPLADAELRRLATALAFEPARLQQRLDRHRQRSFMWLQRRVSPQRAAAVAALQLPGVGFRREYQRFYPAAETTAHLLGVTNIDDEGIEGVELAFDEALRAVPGHKKVLRDRLGNNIKDLDYGAAPRFGRDLFLSIDLRLQYFAYRELKAAVVSHGAQSGSLVMLRPSTGEVLAMVNQPAYNPNRRVTDYARMRNRAVTDMYEPGSTVKPLTLVAALESGLFEPGSRIDTHPGWLQVGRKRIEDPNDRGVLSMAALLARSSQVGIAKVALELPVNDVHDLFARTGFGVPTGLGLPGEASGRLQPVREGDDVSRVTLAYGYGFAVTPLQLALGYQALANDGVLYPVSVLRRSAPPPGQRVFTAAAAAAVRPMLAGVVQDRGTAPQAPGGRLRGGRQNRHGAQGGARRL